MSDPQARAILITASGGGLPGVQAKDYKDVLEDLTRREIKGLTSLTRPGAVSYTHLTLPTKRIV